MKYEDFVVQITSGRSGYRVQVVRSPEGETSDVFVLPFPLDRLGEALETLSLGVRAREPVGHWQPGAEPLDPASFGDQLFRSLFPRPICALFDRSLATLSRADPAVGLRLQLKIDPQDPDLFPLQRLSWELLYRDGGEGFLALDERTPVVRYLDVPRPRQALPVLSSLRILVLVANDPRLGPILEVDEELRLLRSAFGDRVGVEVEIVKNVTRNSLAASLRTKPFDVLHFIGHGRFDEETGTGSVLFLGPDDLADPMSGADLSLELRACPSLRLALLNACNTARSAKGFLGSPFAGVAPALVFGGLPAVLAMQFPMSDQAAVAFSRIFYQHVAAGASVEAAMTAARLALRREQSGWEWATPVLFLRSQDGEGARKRGGALWLLGVLALLLVLGVGLLKFPWNRGPSPAQLLSEEGTALLLAGKTTEARDKLLEAVTLDPDLAPAHSNLSRAEEETGNPEEALEHAKKAQALAPDEALYLYNLGSLEARLDRKEDALTHLQKAVELNPRYAKAYNEMGRLYLQWNRLPEAREHLEKGLAADTMLPALHRNLGIVALAECRFPDAIDCFTEALRQSRAEPPLDTAESVYGLAMAQFLTFKIREACERITSYREFDAHGIGPQAEGAAQLQGACSLFSPVLPNDLGPAFAFEYIRMQAQAKWKKMGAGCTPVPPAGTQPGTGPTFTTKPLAITP